MAPLRCGARPFGLKKKAERATGTCQRAETDMRIFCAFILFVFGVSAASAEIRINVSRIENGALTVSGETRPNQTVTLDGKYQAKSDAAGRFAFHLSYKPDTCMSDIKSGDDVYSAVIAGCLIATQLAAPEPSPTSGKPPG